MKDCNQALQCQHQMNILAERTKFFFYHAAQLNPSTVQASIFLKLLPPAFNIMHIRAQIQVNTSREISTGYHFFLSQDHPMRH